MTAPVIDPFYTHLYDTCNERLKAVEAALAEVSAKQKQSEDDETAAGDVSSANVSNVLQSSEFQQAVDRAISARLQQEFQMAAGSSTPPETQSAAPVLTQTFVRGGAAGARGGRGRGGRGRARGRGRGGTRNGGNGESRKPAVTVERNQDDKSRCDFCGRQGHQESRCWDRMRERKAAHAKHGNALPSEVGHSRRGRGSRAARGN
ncbi:uncharacterized protein LOC129595523 [Paramacrobiotus metropolitanus]|uniref:uncharacterized protein LOC129587336 n=1 Tax=Paramacrobiotus metropolitanus TaxID=2943436 RepID=UPI002445E6AD|nr:uncharacterized protein LOC129587336 [Paramacrobiotus metropolitanus]XP_055340279.1 uncharacterized protein LOC129589514 [Paramacrobiotus metropolitanus]XP_055344902.1 uncharacterized protein LOC129592808 [Paramacrobiotus metropolitanus]XP_055345232.1 uncharacterized protein LOC129593071 isoform X2 [Paramacrobiotus metropolitanus]XP_055347868.1 uncharacterized protein LOC129594998 [Paramacrobiotus metropolitanus]XP_055348539.1 uncharacterized protein LOC129595523 [Paramacrobiotus metropolit